MRLFNKLGIIGLSALSLASCATKYPIYGAMNTMNFTESGAVKSVEPKQMLFTQKVRGVKAVELTEDTKFAASPGFGKTNYEFAKGFQLYAVIAPVNEGSYYCGYNATAKSGILHINGLDPLDRACFADEDKNGTFDAFFVLNSQQTSFFGGGTTGEPGPLDTEIPYRNVSIENTPTGEIGIYYDKFSRLYTAVLAGEDSSPSIISNENVEIKKIETFPETVTIGGVEIEVINLDEDKVMTYKVIKAYPEDFLITQRTTVSY